jgi:hypothetical protein
MRTGNYHQVYKQLLKLAGLPTLRSLETGIERDLAMLTYAEFKRLAGLDAVIKKQMSEAAIRSYTKKHLETVSDRYVIDQLKKTIKVTGKQLHICPEIIEARRQLILAKRHTVEERRALSKTRKQCYLKELNKKNRDKTSEYRRKLLLRDPDYFRRKLDENRQTVNEKRRLKRAEAFREIKRARHSANPHQHAIYQQLIKLSKAN